MLIVLLGMQRCCSCQTLIVTIWANSHPTSPPRHANDRGRRMKPKSSNIWRIAVILLCTPLFPALVRAETAKKILLLVAHPDDEYYFAATVYRMAVQLNTQVDEIIITNGEGGFRYSTLAEPYYKKSLTVEA